jgi:FtsH-binding integral membrane protein
MKPSMQKYTAMDNEQPSSVIQAELIPQNPEFTIITADTPQPTRQKFITRVYSILWAQLMVTSIFIGCCNQIQPLQKFMISDWGSTIVFPCFILMLVLSCMLYCQQDLIRTCPGSGVYLTLFTGASTYILGYVGISTNPETLLLAGLSTLGIFSGLSLYAVQTKYDYTDKGGYLLASLLGLIIFGIFIPFTNLPILSIVYSSVGSIIFSFYIVYDTQLIVGGNHRSIMFHIDDYVLAAVSLYLDIINLFLMLLDLLNGRS